MIAVNDLICEYIYTNWIKSYKSQRAFADDHNIDESTVRKIKKAVINGENYNIPVVTLNKICEARSIKLSEFLNLMSL